MASDRALQYLRDAIQHRALEVERYKKELMTAEQEAAGYRELIELDEAFIADMRELLQANTPAPTPLSREWYGSMYGHDEAVIPLTRAALASYGLMGSEAQLAKEFDRLRKKSNPDDEPPESAVSVPA